MTETAAVLLALLAGAAAGALVAWLAATARSRASAAEAGRLAAEAGRVAAAQLAAVQSDLAGLRSEHAGLRAERDGLAARAEESRATAAAEAGRARTAETEAAAAQAALAAQERAGADRERLLARRDEELREAFRALSADALSVNNEAFVRLAEARIKEATAALSAQAQGDVAARSRALEALLDPVAKTLHRVEGQLRSVEKDRESAYAGLREQVGAMHRSSEQLQAETRALVTALRAPQVRGRWGEVQLERVVQLAGMVEHCDFSRQVVALGADGDEDSRIRPDLVVHLAGGKQVVVDAKVPFAAYLEAVEARDEASRNERMAAHARQLGAHVDALAGKSYWRHFEPSPEFVVLFVPGDPFLEAALQADPGLLEHAFERNVVVATPTTLIALLRTVAYTWRQEALAHNAAQVHALGRELHARLATMGSHLAKLGRQLDSAVDSYNRTVSSVESRVLVTARRFADLQVTDDGLDVPVQVERAARRVQAPELVASAADALVALESPRATVNE